jgi:hypothetical protein
MAASPCHPAPPAEPRRRPPPRQVVRASYLSAAGAPPVRYAGAARACRWLDNGTLVKIDETLAAERQAQ